MSIRARILLPALVLAALLAPGPLPGQSPPPPPPRPLTVAPEAELGRPEPLTGSAATPTATGPVSPPGLDYLPPPPPPPPAPSAAIAPPAPPAAVSDPWGPYAPPPGVQPGPFVRAEVEYLFPMLQGRVGNGIAVDPTSPLPGSNLRSTVAPWLEVGYVLGPDLGLVAGNYRFFSTDGTTNVTVGGLPAQVHSRLSINMGDLDYGTLPAAFAPRWTWQGRLGIRWADTFYQTQLQTASSFQQESNVFYGAGPHGRIDLNRQFALLPGLSLFGRLDGGFLFGQVHQQYLADADTPLGAISGSITQRRTQTVPIVLLQAGLQYTPLSATYLHFTLGYQYEHWWYVGRIGDDPAFGNFNHTVGSFGAQGVFLRGQVDF